jgi:hypothetical protein
MTFSEQENEFKRGFIEGYKTVMGNNVSVPFAPSMPGVFNGRTAFQVGIQRGAEEGNKRKGFVGNAFQRIPHSY